VKKFGFDITALLVYVDDMVLTGNSIAEINAVKVHLHSRFYIKELGPIKYFLGLEVFRSLDGLVLNQRKYCLDLISEPKMLGCKLTPTPFDPSIKLHVDEGALLPDPSSFRSLIGRLLYLTNTRPDISFVVQQLIQFVSSLHEPHMQQALRIIRHLKNVHGDGLLYKSNTSLKIQAFSDFHWATCATTRRSVSGYFVFIGTSLVAWKSKKQTTVSRSSSKAEYRTLASLACEL